MERKYIKEKIGILKTEMNLLWNSVFVTFGGSLAICLNMPMSWRWLFPAVGFLLSAIFLNAFVIKRNEAIRLTEILNGEKQ